MPGTGTSGPCVEYRARATCSAKRSANGVIGQPPVHCVAECDRAQLLKADALTPNGGHRVMIDGWSLSRERAAAVTIDRRMFAVPVVGAATMVCPTARRSAAGRGGLTPHYGG